MTPSSSHRPFNPTVVLQFVIPTERAERRFMLSSRPRERSDVSCCHPDRRSEETFHAVIPTEGAERRFMLSTRPKERRDVSFCHPDRESGANERRDPWVKFGWVGGRHVLNSQFSIPTLPHAVPGGWAANSKFEMSGSRRAICVHQRDLRFLLCAGGWTGIQNSKLRIELGCVGGNSEFLIPNS